MTSMTKSRSSDGGLLLALVLLIDILYTVFTQENREEQCQNIFHVVWDVLDEHNCLCVTYQ